MDPVTSIDQPQSMTPKKSIWLLISLFSIFMMVTFISIGYFFYQNRELKKQLSQSANLKIYTNQDYAFQIKYPDTFSSEVNSEKEDYYDNLILLSSLDAEITIKAIHDIDIYYHSKPEEVAKREIMDSGFAYDITNATVSGYAMAFTTLKTSPKQHIIITIAHPIKNLFIQISSDGTKEELDQILSTFKFFE